MSKFDQEETAREFEERNPWFRENAALSRAAVDLEARLARQGMSVDARLGPGGAVERTIMRGAPQMFLQPGDENGAYGMMTPGEQAAFNECRKVDSTLTATEYVALAGHRDIRDLLRKG